MNRKPRLARRRCIDIKFVFLAQLGIQPLAGSALGKLIDVTENNRDDPLALRYEFLAWSSKHSESCSKSIFS